MVDHAGVVEALRSYATPFQTLKTAEQEVQFAIDPSRGLTRQRYGWHSNDTLFDSTLFTNDPGEITLATTATGTDEARIRSAFAGQYISQSLAEPGLRIAIPEADRTIDGDGRVSLSHGELFAGAYFWDTGTDSIDTGIALGIDGTEATAVWRSNGTHFGNSPVSQGSWNIDKLDGTGPSGITFDPADGWVINGLYWWYNAGKLRLALVDPVTDALIPFHDFNPREVQPGDPSLETPNLPVQLVVRNAGTADTLEARLGGMQFSTYGASGVSQTRDTYGTNTGVSVTTDTPAAIDPTATQGEPIYALQRESGQRDLELRLDELFVDTPNDVTVYFFDEYDPATALTNESFESTFRFNAEETNTQFDRSATAYTPTTAVFRGLTPVDSGKKNEGTVAAADIEARIPIGATRVVTATDDNSADPAADVFARHLEGY